MLEPIRYAVLDDPVYGAIGVEPDRTRVSEDCDLVRLYPGMWRQVPDVRRAERYYATDGDAMRVERIAGFEAAADPSCVALAKSPTKAVDGLERWRVVGGGKRVGIRAGAKPRGRIRLAPAARDTISRALAEGGKVLETGGGLFGVASGDGLTDVVFASGPTPGAKRTPKALLLDFQWLRSEADRQGLSFVGCWHSHPSARPIDRVPSPTDVDTFDLLRSQGGTATFTALICSPEIDGTWIVDAWTVSRTSCIPTNIYGVE